MLFTTCDIIWSDERCCKHYIHRILIWDKYKRISVSTHTVMIIAKIFNNRFLSLSESESSISIAPTYISTQMIKDAAKIQIEIAWSVLARWIK